MSADKENVAVGGAQTTAKKVRRVVSNQTKAVAQLRFHEKDASPQNGLFIGHLESVSVDWSLNSEGKQFTGEKIPRVTLHFASNHTNASEQRHVYYTLNCVESNVNAIPGGTEEWKVNNIFNWMKHILDVYVLKGRDMTEEEEIALSLPFEDYDDEGNYVAVDTADVIAGYAHIFNNFAAIMNGLDAVISTGGIGENAPNCREEVCENMEYLGIQIDKQANDFKGQLKKISTPDSKVEVWVIPTNEELLIARDTLAMVEGLKK